jgi:hypothetical protein
MMIIIIIITMTVIGYNFPRICYGLVSNQGSTFSPIYDGDGLMYLEVFQIGDDSHDMYF